jgi:hypothetical protein
MIRGSSLAGLSHEQGGTIKLQRANRGRCQYSDLLPLSGHSRHGQTCYWLDPSAHAPNQTFAFAAEFGYRDGRSMAWRCR